MKKTYLLGSAIAVLVAAAPAVLQAQQLPPAVVAVVNRTQIARDCTPCAAALQNLSQQGQQYQQFEQQQLQPLQNEGNAIRTALQALPQGGQPDAQLTQRIQTFENNRTNVQNQLAARQEQIRRNEQYIVNQILMRMQPLIQQISTQRGATLTIDSGDALFAAPQIDITPAVLALMNQNTAAFATVAPAPTPPAPAAARPGTPAPATPAPAQPNRPRPQGR